MRRHHVAIALGTTVLATAVLATALLAYSRTSEETAADVSANAALEKAGADADVEDAGRVAFGAGPDSGTATWTGNGSERVKSIGTVDRTMPQRAASVVSSTGGCAWRVDVVLGEAHTEQMDMCLDRGGTLSFDGFAHEIAATGGSLLERFRCDAPIVVAGTGARPRQEVTCKEVEADVTAKVRADVKSHVERIAGTSFACRLVDLHIRYSGESRGTERTARCFSDDGTLVAIRGMADVEADLGITATYRGRFEYRRADAP